MSTGLTVFTPAYNRAEKLKRAYESLKRQTERDFVWIIVDDGSVDDTENVVKGFIKEGEVDIKYFRQTNGGKMRAHNRGVGEADSELFICLDSDDLLTDRAVERIFEVWEGIGDKSSYAGIIAYKGEIAEKTEGSDRGGLHNSDKGRLLPIYGNYFPDNEDCSFRELYRKGFKGETTLVFRTELLKKHPFPEIEGEKYVPEDVVYDRVDEGHIFRVVPEILTLCELIEDGYTDRAEELRRQAPTGWFIYYYQRALSWPWSLIRFKFASHYLRFSSRVDKKYRREYDLPAALKLAGIPGWLALVFRGKL